MAGPGVQGVSPRPWCHALVCPPQAQFSPGPQTTYRDCLSKLDLQYEKLLVRRQVGDDAWAAWTAERAQGRDPASSPFGMCSSIRGPGTGPLPLGVLPVLPSGKAAAVLELS